MGRRLAAALAAALAAGSAVLQAAAPASASSTDFWISRSAEDYREASWYGVVVGADGTVRRGLAARAVAVPEADVAWAVWADGDSALVGTGHGGQVYEWVGERAVPLDSTGVGQILCFARGPDGALYLGTAPEGRVLRLVGRRASVHYESGDGYVWGLAWSGGRLYAATGVGGHLHEIRAAGEGRTVFTVPEGQATAVIPDGSGGVYFATSGGSAVYHHREGRTRALFAAEEPEIRALAFDGQALYAAALSVPAAQGEEARAATPRAAANRGGTPRSVVYRIAPDGAVRAHWEAPQGYVYALAPRVGLGYWAATGGRAGIYEVDEAGLASAHYQADEGEVTGLFANERTVWAAMSDPVRLLRLGPEAPQGWLASETFDASRVARWGRFTVEGEPRGARFETRSGHTEPPDSTWDEWRPVRPGESVHSAPARHLQWRAHLTGGAALSEVRVAVREVNQPPVIRELVVHPLPGDFYEGEISPRQEPVTQMLPGGQRVQYSVQNPPPGPLEALPAWVAGLRPVSWKAEDPNQDALRYQLAYRREGETEWIPAARDLAVEHYTWDASSLPEGRYELRLTASDEGVNGAEALATSRVASAVVVDLTPPTLALEEVRVEGRDALITGTAEDGGPYVALVEALPPAAERWVPATPEDGLWDSPRERFRLRLAGLPPGPQALRVRAIDALGNVTTRTAEVRVAP